MNSIRLYPWKCPVCRQKAMTATQVVCDEPLEHDGKTYPIRIEILPVVQCANCKEEILTDESNRCISDALRRAAGLLSPAMILSSRESLGWSQDQLASALQVSTELVSIWEQGGILQKHSEDGAMRRLFAAAPVSLDTAIESNGSAHSRFPENITKE